MKFSFVSLKKRTKRLIVGSGVVAILLAAGIIQQQFFEASEVSIGRQAQYRLDSYPWREAPHRVRLVHDPSEAFSLRRQLIRQATTSIDMCTFLWKDDEMGLALLQELVAAAERGVKVRLLGDGIFFMRQPAKVAAIAQAHPRLNLRLYNPLDHEVASLEPSSLEKMVLDFSEINQRLHMKILAIDDRQALVGGRNVGNEYFGRDEELNFMDRDLLIEGPAVTDIAAAFGLFWNDLRTETALELDDVASSSPNTSWLQQPTGDFVTEKKEQPLWREVDRVAVWHDRPGLIGSEDEYNYRLLADKLVALVGGAEQSVIIETPYLVLSERTQVLLKELRRKKPEMPIRFLTNSLASTDTWQAYAAFQEQLRTMLGELRLLLHLKKPGSLRERSGESSKTSSLHSKTIIVDEQKSAIGSYNWDPRSGIWNAEIMVVIDDTAFARELTQYMEPLWTPEVSWVVAELQQPIGLEQIDAIGSTVNALLAETLGINAWPLTNTACFEYSGSRVLSPFHPDFYDHYTSVGSFPEVSITARKRILTNLLQPISGTLAPTL